jgi:hyperosmotically inducible protein
MCAFRKLSAVAVVALLAATGCQVMHHEETAGQYIDDATLSARAQAALVQDKNVKSADFSLEVNQGNVTLTGVAKSPAEAKQAEQDIRAIDGVKSVKSDVLIADRSASN